jgi:hypothetical protein
MKAPCIPVIQLREGADVAGGSSGHELLVLYRMLGIRRCGRSLLPHVACMAAPAARVRAAETLAAGG